MPISETTDLEIQEIHQPFVCGGPKFSAVSIRKTSHHQARRVLHALWGTKLLSQTKIIVVVDADQDPNREQEVWFRVGNMALVP